MPGSNIEKRVPPVQWAERRTMVYVFIHAPDTEKPEIKLTPESLFFSAKSVAGDTVFEVTLNFYKEMDVEASKYCVSDRGVDFYLKKAEDGPYWDRLLKDVQKVHWLKIDFNRWRDEDDSDIEMDQETFEDMMKKMSGLQSSSNDLGDLDSGESQSEDEELEGYES